MKRFYGLLSAVFIAGIVSAGCAPSSRAQSSSPLADWTGTWNNFSSYFNNPGIAKAYEILAEREGKSPGDIKARYTGTYRCDIAAMRIQDDTITFYTETQSVNGAVSNVAYTARYAYKGEVPITSSAYGTSTWQHFETTGDVPYKHFVAKPAESDIPGETMIHFHFRYGNDLKELLAADGWYPTMIPYDSTIGLLVGHMTAEED